jgi:hypothetical protein
MTWERFMNRHWFRLLGLFGFRGGNEPGVPEGSRKQPRCSYWLEGDQEAQTELTILD